MNKRFATVAATAVIAVCSSFVAPSVVSATSAPATPALPVAWRASSAAALNEPALTPTGVVTTAGNVATARGLAHGALLWKQAVPNQSEYTVLLGAPTVYNGVVDAVMGIVFGQGVADFAVTNGAQTLSDPGLHALLGQLVVDSVTATRVQGGYGSGVGPWYEMNLGGDTWFLEYGDTSPGLPALAGARAFVPVGDDVFAEDPAQGCPPLPIPNPPSNLCAPTWQAAFPGAPNTPAGIGTARVVVSDASGVVTALNAATGKLAWATSSFHTPLGPPAYANNVVYVGGADGVLRAINATTGKLLWMARAGAPIRTAPAASGSRVFVATDNGRLVTFNAAGCGKVTCAPTAVGNAALSNTQAAGAPLVRNNVAVVAYSSHLIAFAV